MQCHSHSDSPHKAPSLRPWLGAVLLACLCSVLAACGRPVSLPPEQTQTKELVLYIWAEYMPPSVIDAFEAEYGIAVRLETYDSMEEAAESIRAGRAFDLAVIESDLLPELFKAGLLAEIDWRNVSNFKHVSANFRGLLFDPEDRYSVAWGWGTLGLLVRSDLVGQPVTRWADLWDPRFAGKIAARPQPVELMSIALRSLGYPLNSEDPQQLDAALARLIQLKPTLTFVGVEAEEAVAPLLSGQALIFAGWPGDALYARQQNAAIQYVMPEEGTMLWGDRLVISARSARKHTAELFLDFLLRPEMNAELSNTYYYAMANEAARAFVNPEILADPVIYPPMAILAGADWYLPLSPEGEQRYAAAWQRFLAAE
jgi:spermidine/putrescine transport system substrate-binding protein